ncbi:MAG TPA: glycoside hydrolase family 99 protein [Bacteroidia bacterium]|nr:glycoside hydrolase family 99 protein [Bacteroidia bacterium]HNU32234.1 glycoside hydrolase family 99 protein [Bacteroidia bacterium]
MIKVFFMLSINFLLFVNAPAQNNQLNYNAVCFYYNWYGSVQINGKPYHWAHIVMKQNDKDTATSFFSAEGNIGANFYPEAGEYSSADSSIVDLHMRQIAKAGIGVLAVTWLGKDDYTFNSVLVVLNAAARYAIKICFQIEPVVRKTAFTTRFEMECIISKFGNHQAFYRNAKTNRPLFFIYDSYVIDARQWAQVLTESGSHTIRNTSIDADVIGLWVTEKEEEFFLTSGFDGFYTYFASSGFTYGSTPANWKKMQQWAKQNNKIFIPSVGPGYLDERIRPWNAGNTKNRQNGKYYDDMFNALIKSGTQWVGITSFNEWHEGTQIEPAKPFMISDFKYEDYEPLAPDYYLNRTKYWLEKFEAVKEVTK